MPTFKMASNLAFVFFLSVVVATFSLPISLDVKTEELSDGGNPPTWKTLVTGAEITLSVEEEFKQEGSLTTETVIGVSESVKADDSKRIRRHITRPKDLCPRDMIQYGTKCLTQEEYDDYNDISDGSDNNDAKR